MTKKEYISPELAFVSLFGLHSFLVVTSFTNESLGEEDDYSDLFF